MLSIIKELFSLLNKDQRKRFFALQFLVILMSLMEIIGVSSIIPFMAIVGDITQLQKDTLVAEIYTASGIQSEIEFVILLGFMVLVMLLISSIISMFTIWRLCMFGHSIGIEIADRLYSHYLKQDWLFHASGSSAQLIKKVATEAQRVTSGIVMPLMRMNARIVFAIFMSLTIFLYDPMVAIVGLSIFSFAYIILYKIVRLKLQRNGEAISHMNENRFRLMNEGFGGIKDVLLLGRDKDFIERFNQSGKTFAHSQGNTDALTEVPRYFVELIAFGSMISLVLYLLVSHDANLGVILPIISVYALATLKLLPALQLTYVGFGHIRANIAAFQSIQQDLINSSKAKKSPTYSSKEYLIPKKHILLEDISFRYPGKKELALSDINLKIPVNSVVGIVGPSGAGKSTLIDILLSLIEPQKGQLKVDDTIINNQNCRFWQNTIGFVAQSIFLTEGTFLENVAFGVPKNQIDLEKAKQALQLAHLDELLESLEKGVYTQVGERGVQLSGGQRQRIGIARALYHESRVLVFDEATSSLDGITEKIIMEAIQSFGGKKTIILVTHRLQTVQKCDEIFFIDSGKVVDQGNYEKLINTNLKFKRMATHV